MSRAISWALVGVVFVFCYAAAYGFYIPAHRYGMALAFGVIGTLILWLWTHIDADVYGEPPPDPEWEEWQRRFWDVSGSEDRR